MHKTIQKGILLAMCTALISGFSIFYNKLVLVKGVDSLIFNILKNGGVAIILSILLLGFSKKRIFFTQSVMRHWWQLILIGFIGGSIPFFLFFEGLKMTSAINATLIHKTLFIWVAIIAIPLLGEHLSFWQIIGYLIIIYSNFFIGGFSGMRFGQGELMIVTATLLWTAETIIAKIFLKDIESMVLAWGRMFFGVLFLTFFALFQGKLHLLTQISNAQFLPMLGSILFLTGYVSSWYYALKLAPAVSVTAVLVLSTPITNVLTAVFITHSLTQIQFINNMLIIIGVAFISFALSSFQRFIKQLSARR